MKPRETADFYPESYKSYPNPTHDAGRGRSFHFPVEPHDPTVAARPAERCGRGLAAVSYHVVFTPPEPASCHQCGGVYALVNPHGRSCSSCSPEGCHWHQAARGDAAEVGPVTGDAVAALFGPPPAKSNTSTRCRSACRRRCPSRAVPVAGRHRRQQYRV